MKLGLLDDVGQKRAKASRVDTGYLRASILRRSRSVRRHAVPRGHGHSCGKGDVSQSNARRTSELSVKVLVLMIVVGVLVAGCAPRVMQTSDASTLQRPTERLTAANPARPTPTIAFGPKPVTAPAPAVAQAPSPPQVGRPASDFQLTDLKGRRVSLSDYRGRKVMLNFWATWCGPCRIEIPYMVQLYSEMQGKPFEILAVDLREDPARVGQFVDQFGMRFPILIDTTGKVGSAYFVNAIPTSVFIDENGVIKAIQRGSLSDAMLRKYVHDLLG